MSNHHKFKNSSSLAHCDYDDAANVLKITFQSGQTYHYYDCPKHVYDQMKIAASAGQFFQKHVRGKFSENKM
jgi:hypothetical protein